MRAVQWPIPGILKVPAPVEELERGVRAGTRSRRSPTPFRNWTASVDRGWAKEGRWRERMKWYCDSSFINYLTHIHTPPCVCFSPTVQLQRGVRPAGPGSAPDASTGGHCFSSVSPAPWPTGPVCCAPVRKERGIWGMSGLFFSFYFYFFAFEQIMRLYLKNLLSGFKTFSSLISWGYMLK